MSVLSYTDRYDFAKNFLGMEYPEEIDVVFWEENVFFEDEFGKNRITEKSLQDFLDCFGCICGKFFVVDVCCSGEIYIEEK